MLFLPSKTEKKSIALFGFLPPSVFISQEKVQK